MNTNGDNNTLALLLTEINLRKKELLTAMWGIIANPRGSTICFLGLTSYGRPLNQRAYPTGEIICFEKEATDSRVGYHCKALRPHNPFLGVPSL